MPCRTKAEDATYANVTPIDSAMTTRWPTNARLRGDGAARSSQGGQAAAVSLPRGQRLGDPESGRHDHEGAQAGHHPERDPPVGELQDGGPHERSDDGRDPRDTGDEVQAADEARPVGQVDDHGACGDHRPAPAEPLDETGHHHELDRRAHGAGHGRDGQDGEREQKRSAAPPSVRDGAPDELPQRHPDEERRERQLHLRRPREQVLAHPGKCRHVHVGGQRGDRAHEDDRREERTADPDRGCRDRHPRRHAGGWAVIGGGGHRLSSRAAARARTVGASSPPWDRTGEGRGSHRREVYR